MCVVVSGKFLVARFHRFFSTEIFPAHSLMPKYLVKTLLTFPSRIGFLFLKAIAEMAPAVDLPIPGKAKSSSQDEGNIPLNFL